MEVDKLVEINIVCEKSDVDGIVTFLECEGYRLHQPSIPFFPMFIGGDIRKEMYYVLVERTVNDRKARDEFNILYSSGWFSPPSSIIRCNIIGDNGDRISWPR